jgi:hypothetical protein
VAPDFNLVAVVLVAFLSAEITTPTSHLMAISPAKIPIAARSRAASRELPPTSTIDWVQMRRLSDQRRGNHSESWGAHHDSEQVDGVGPSVVTRSASDATQRAYRDSKDYQHNEGGSIAAEQRYRSVGENREYE